VHLASEEDARRLISRAILADAIYELWGTGDSYESLHNDVRRRTQHLWHQYKHDSFRFNIYGFQGKRSSKEQREIIDSFSYVEFEGPIRMKDSKHVFNVFEEYGIAVDKPRVYATTPSKLFLARLIAYGGRAAIKDYDLKKRRYINTTSMDSELALLTANMALASSGKLFYDPFVGTGSFPIACSHFGAITIGSDIDGRIVRGKPANNISTSFEQYGLRARWLDGFISDLTNTPLRLGRCLDGIVCDPPYGIREGVKVLGRKDGLGTEELIIDGVAAH
jgi:tRNA (guanine10-N2)-methyltransferase